MEKNTARARLEKHLYDGSFTYLAPTDLGDYEALNKFVEVFRELTRDFPNDPEVKDFSIFFRNDDLLDHALKTLCKGSTDRREHLKAILDRHEAFAPERTQKVAVVRNWFLEKYPNFPRTQTPKALREILELLEDYALRAPELQALYPPKAFVNPNAKTELPRQLSQALFECCKYWIPTEILHLSEKYLRIGPGGMTLGEFLYFWDKKKISDSDKFSDFENSVRSRENEFNLWKISITSENKSSNNVIKSNDSISEDPILTQVNEQHFDLSNEFDNLKLELSQLEDEEKKTSMEVLELTQLFTNAVKSMENLSDKKELALAGHDNVKRQAELKNDAEKRLRIIQKDLQQKRNLIEENKKLTKLLEILSEDRKTLNEYKNLRERVEKSNIWMEKVRLFFINLEEVSVENLTKQQDILNQLKQAGIEPGLEDFLRLSNQKIDGIVRKAKIELDSDAAFIDPSVRRAVLIALNANAEMRKQVNRTARLFLEETLT